jgi:pimeloyl-ACP methyl ester carboxylesterase
MSAAEWSAARVHAETSFGRIAYVERGSGDVALFLHGFPLSGFQWRGAVARLASDRRCLAPDFLAMGQTEVAKGQSVGPGSQVSMLAELLDRLSIGRVDVIANDSGGLTAQLFLARHPERVRSLLLTNCDSEIDSPPPFLLPVIELAKRGAFVDEILVPQLADTEFARSAKGIGGQCYADPGHPTDEAIELHFSPLVSSARRRALANAFAVALERNPLAGLEPVLRRSTIPVRIVWGEADRIFSSASPGYLDRTFGGSRGIRLLPGRKLFWPEELPEVIAEEARRLWTGVMIEHEAGHGGPAHRVPTWRRHDVPGQL